MASVYVKIKVADVSQEILDRSVGGSLFNLKTTTDGLYTILEFEEFDVPADIYLLGYSLLNKTGAITELSNGWNE